MLSNYRKINKELNDVLKSHSSLRLRAVSQVLSKLEVQHFIKQESNPNNHRDWLIEH